MLPLQLQAEREQGYHNHDNQFSSTSTGGSYYSAPPYGASGGVGMGSTPIPGPPTYRAQSGIAGQYPPSAPGIPPPPPPILTTGFAPSEVEQRQDQRQTPIVPPPPPPPLQSAVTNNPLPPPQTSAALYKPPNALGTSSVPARAIQPGNTYITTQSIIVSLS